MTKMNTSIQSAMKSLDFLIGRWNTEGEILANEGNTAIHFKGTDRYEWILDGHYIRHEVNVIMDQEKVEAIEIIGEFNPETKRYKMRSFDNKGTFTEMDGYFDEKGTFHSLGSKMRSELSITDNHTLAASWENTKDNQNWRPWMELTLSKFYL